jgi:hypothetical protein
MEKYTVSARRERIEGSNLLNIASAQKSQVLEKNPAIQKLIKAGYKIFSDYLEWLGLSPDPNIIVLSPSRHYYYDDEDLKEVSTILNLEHLNHIKEVRVFLQTINQMLPSGSYFIGSFIDKRNHNGLFSSASMKHEKQWKVDPVKNGISSRIPILNMIYEFMDSRTNNRNMTGRSVTLLLENAGMKIVDMTEISGITYFCAQKGTAAVQIID